MQLQAMLLIVVLFTNMTTLCKTQTPFNIITSPILNLLAPELFFFNFSTRCKLNANITGTKYVTVMKQTAF